MLHSGEGIRREEQTERIEQASLNNNVMEGVGSLDSPMTPHIAGVFRTYGAKRLALSPLQEELPDLMVGAKLKEKMELAIQKEVRFAQEEGHVYEGKTWIRVTIDGGWGKRSYGHGYNSNSGLTNSGQRKEVREHVCNRNFTGASTGEVEQLRTDLRNGPNHIFGSHSACRETYCTRKNTEETNFIPILEKSDLLGMINLQIEKVVSISDTLTTNETTNTVEHLMSFGSKFTGAKRVDYGKGQYYHRRCAMAGLVHTGGLPDYITSPWKLASGSSPGGATNKLVQKRQERSAKQKLLYAVEPQQGRKKKTRSAPPDENNGAILEHQSDMSDKDKNRMSKKVLKFCRGKTTGKTMLGVRRAGIVSVVCKRAESTLCEKLVKQIIVPPILRTNAVLFGQRHEESAKQLYEARYKVKGITHVSRDVIRQAVLVEEPSWCLAVGDLGRERERERESFSSQVCGKDACRSAKATSRAMRESLLGNRSIFVREDALRREFGIAEKASVIFEWSQSVQFAWTLPYRSDACSLD
ncbi:hypothetical protein PR048_014383 [Dryococelus australis]|uniref:Uncharacterized protein n=1 Tax=Dryococelus australis TaxID=614101 RepID=A0ABQ9HE13_9NEOP|nr:hypothetical protein PR048_014383 [Dryococelus australis]